MLVLTFVVIAFLVPAQAAQSQGNDPYTGEPDFYDMVLMPVGKPNPNPNIHYYIPRPRVPEPITVPLPDTPPVYLRFIGGGADTRRAIYEERRAMSPLRAAQSVLTSTMRICGVARAKTHHTHHGMTSSRGGDPLQ